MLKFSYAKASKKLTFRTISKCLPRRAECFNFFEQPSFAMTEQHEKGFSLYVFHDISQPQHPFSKPPLITPRYPIYLQSQHKKENGSHFSGSCSHTTSRLVHKRPGNGSTISIIWNYFPCSLLCTLLLLKSPVNSSDTFLPVKLP